MSAEAPRPLELNDATRVDPAVFGLYAAYGRTFGRTRKRGASRIHDQHAGLGITLKEGTVRMATDGNIAREQVETLLIVTDLPAQARRKELGKPLDAGAVVIPPVVVAQAHVHGRYARKPVVVRLGAYVARMHDVIGSLQGAQQLF